eukprot:SAG22_NODE_1299_length_4809_cov_3.052866_4_plen_354_part_00
MHDVRSLNSRQLASRGAFSRARAPRAVTAASRATQATTLVQAAARYARGSFRPRCASASAAAASAAAAASVSAQPSFHRLVSRRPYHAELVLSKLDRYRHYSPPIEGTPSAGTDPGSMEATTTKIEHPDGTTIVTTTMAPAAAAGGAAEATLISGTAISKELRLELKEEVEKMQAEHKIIPGLAVVLVGERPDSATYVRMKKKAAAEVGFHSVDVTLAADIPEDALLAEIKKLNDDPSVHAILVQLPLPKHCDESTVLSAIDLAKDADGFLPENIGRMCLRGGSPPYAVSCTPAGCIELLQRSGVEVSGKSAVVLGRSNIVGMPVAHLLQSMDATVTVRQQSCPSLFTAHCLS